MRLFLIIVLSCFSMLVVLSLGYLLYERNEMLRTYKREIFGMRTDYQTLQTAYDTLQAKVRSLRKITILSSTQASKNTQIGNSIHAHVNKINGDISIYYKNLSTDESVVIDGDKKYYMASLYKVILTLYMLGEVRAGNVSLNDPIGDSTVEEALNKIITESNNEYAQLLANTYGWDVIEAKMKEKLGIEFRFDTTLETSVVSMGGLFADIALSLKVTGAETEYLLRLLKDQTRTSKLPKYLPATIYSHNKTGEYEGFSHDAGIFYTPKANYILIFMSNTPIPGETNEQMALMSKEIYETLNDAKIAANQ